MALALLGGLLAPGRVWAQRPVFTPQEVAPLVERLAQDGLPRWYVQRVLSDGRLRRLNRAIDLNVVTPDTQDRYAQYTGWPAMLAARLWRERNRKLLEEAERRYQVDQEVIVAILLVETRFGTYPMRFRPLEVFATLGVEAVQADPQAHYQRLKAQHPEVTLAYVEERLEKKSRWALEELKALLQWGLQTGHDPYTLKGSFAGAVGMPQFLPSSYLRWGVDGDGDGKVDLRHSADAVASVAHYLKEHGWSYNQPAEERRQVIWSYNHSNDYVTAVLEIARLLSGRAETTSPSG